MWAEHKEPKGVVDVWPYRCRPWASSTAPRLKIGTAAPLLIDKRARVEEARFWRGLFRGRIPGLWGRKHGPSLHLLPLCPSNTFLGSLLPFCTPPPPPPHTSLKQFKHSSHLLQLLPGPRDSQSAPWTSKAKTPESEKRREWCWQWQQRVPAWAQSSKASCA